MDGKEVFSPCGFFGKGRPTSPACRNLTFHPAEIRGMRVPRGTAIQTSSGICVPTSWSPRAEVRQITERGTVAVATARSWCSIVRVAV